MFGRKAKRPAAPVRPTHYKYMYEVTRCGTVYAWRAFRVPFFGARQGEGILLGQGATYKRKESEQEARDVILHERLSEPSYPEETERTWLA